MVKSVAMRVKIDLQFLAVIWKIGRKDPVLSIPQTLGFLDSRGNSTANHCHRGAARKFPH